MSSFQVLLDAQWSLIEKLLQHPTGRPGRKFSEARTVVEGIVYRYRTRIAWRDLPEVYGPWQTVWTWHRRLAHDGTWDKIHAELTAPADTAGLIDWSLSVDSTIARAHQHATNTTRLTGAGSDYKNPGIEPPEHAVGRSRGGYRRRPINSSTATAGPWSHFDARKSRRLAHAAALAERVARRTRCGSSPHSSSRRASRR